MPVSATRRTLTPVDEPSGAERADRQAGGQGRDHLGVVEPAGHPCFGEPVDEQRQGG
jgi:hypothetical protein